LAWQSLGNTLFGYGMWNWLLARHPAAQVAPIGLLVPIFGMSASAYMLGEAMPVWKLIAAALVLAGLGINLAPHRAKRDSAPSAAAE
jgi:O-acetylserine/cysteine efflux transporter